MFWNKVGTWLQKSMKTNQFYNVDFVVFGQFGPCLGFKCTTRNKKSQHVWKRLALWQTITHYLGRFKAIEAVEACIFCFFQATVGKPWKSIKFENLCWAQDVYIEKLHAFFHSKLFFVFVFSTIFSEKKLKTNTMKLFEHVCICQAFWPHNHHTFATWKT